MDKMDNRCVLLFVKYPTRGQVKTRLTAELGTTAAVELYRNFILDILFTLRELRIPFKIFYYPGSAKEKLAEWLGEQYSYTPQSGENLGERMKNAFLQTFSDNFSRVVIIGSDIPDLPADFISQAFGALQSHDAVIGPSNDGGYYLIGFSQTHLLPEAFEGILWGRNSVFMQTVDILNEHFRSVYLLPEWYDVDTLADLNDLVARNKDTDFHRSKTFAYLLKTWGTIA